MPVTEQLKNMGKVTRIITDILSGPRVKCGLADVRTCRPSTGQTQIEICGP